MTMKFIKGNFLKFLPLAIFFLFFFPSLVKAGCYCNPACGSSSKVPGACDSWVKVSECEGGVTPGCTCGCGWSYGCWPGASGDIGWLVKSGESFIIGNTAWTKLNKFPNTGDYNKQPCAIYSPGGWSAPLQCITKGQVGVWDASDPEGPKCIQCYGRIEDKICGDTNSLSLGCSKEGNKKCDSACPGVDPECDEVEDGDHVSVAGGFCKNCIYLKMTQCGDNKIQPPESCDGSDLGGQTCETLDYLGGVLACDPNFCTFDTSGCTGGGPGPTGCPCPETAMGGTCPEELKGGLVPCGKSCDDPDTTWNECCPCQLCHLFLMLDNIVDFILLKVVPPLAILMVVVGGGLFLASTGNPGMLMQGKNILKTTVVALLIIYCSWIIVNTILLFLGVADWVWPSGGWFQINCPL